MGEPQVSEVAKQYDEIEKEEAVILAVRLRSSGAAARELGIHPTTLRGWVKRAQEDGTYAEICRSICSRGELEAAEAMAVAVRQIRLRLEQAKLKGLGELSKAITALSAAQKRFAEVRKQLGNEETEVEQPAPRTFHANVINVQDRASNFLRRAGG